MGPLVPDIIGNELNFIVAIFMVLPSGLYLNRQDFQPLKNLWDYFTDMILPY